LINETIKDAIITITAANQIIKRIIITGDKISKALLVQVFVSGSSVYGLLQFSTHSPEVRYNCLPPSVLLQVIHPLGRFELQVLQTLLHAGHVPVVGS